MNESDKFWSLSTTASGRTSHQSKKHKTKKAAVSAAERHLFKYDMENVVVVEAVAILRRKAPPTVWEPINKEGEEEDNKVLPPEEVRETLTVFVNKQHKITLYQKYVESDRCKISAAHQFARMVDDDSYTYEEMAKNIAASLTETPKEEPVNEGPLFQSTLKFYGELQEEVKALKKHAKGLDYSPASIRERIRKLPS